MNAHNFIQLKFRTEENKSYTYLNFYIANLVGSSNDGSPHHRGEYMCWKIGSGIATFDKLKRIRHKPLQISNK